MLQVAPEFVTVLTSELLTMDTAPRLATTQSALQMPAAVLNFRRAGLHLGQDLADLRATYLQERAPAVLFYCGRILEALVAAAAEGFYGEATTSAGPNLNRLRELGVLNWPRETQLQALRRLALDAHLARRQIHWADVDAAVQLLERLLLWYFVELETGPCLPTLGHAVSNRGASSLMGLTSDTELLDVFARLEQPGEEWRLLPQTQAAVFLRSPVVAALFVERGAACVEPAWADLTSVLNQGLRSFGSDVRLRQLYADSFVAAGQTTQAQHVLEDLNRDQPADSETLRRLGHLYRERWLQVPVEESEAMLRRALQCYQQAWSRSRDTDNESGVHAAVLGLHRGRAQRAEAIAQTVVESYRKRWLALGPRFRFWSFDDRIALAHCALILGETEYARRRYLEAFEAKFASKSGIAAVKRQLKVMLAALDLKLSTTRFLEGQQVRRKRGNAAQLELPQILSFGDTARNAAHGS